MKILLIEDDVNKAEQITGFLGGIGPHYEPVVRRAFQSGLREAILGEYQVILLDMTMPTYEVGPREPGGRERRYAGREILRQLDRRSLPTPVIVITQYEQFEENGETVTLAELVGQLREDYPAIFAGAIFYQAANTSWMDQLRSLLSDIEARRDQT